MVMVSGFGYLPKYSYHRQNRSHLTFPFSKVNPAGTEKILSSKGAENLCFPVYRAIKLIRDNEPERTIFFGVRVYFRPRK